MCTVTMGWFVTFLKIVPQWSHNGWWRWVQYFSQSMLDHKKKQKDVKTAMEEEMEDFRKEQAEMEKVNKEREKQKRAKQQQQIVKPGYTKCSSTYLRPKKFGL
ncbi:hypothetical protein MKX01_039390 [Papaver californicum]|nr:hypothetical protein MKX01_039390 [Papaver californicum]